MPGGEGLGGRRAHIPVLIPEALQEGLKGFGPGRHLTYLPQGPGGRRAHIFVLIPEALQEGLEGFGPGRHLT
jgi:hypothetical protein